jgi:CRP-like cAMP-binding protein
MAIVVGGHAHAQSAREGNGVAMPLAAPPANRILGTLPRHELDRLTPDLEPRSFRAHETLQEPDELIEYVYFPTSGMLSVLTVLEDGESIETASVGSEGMTGARVSLGSTRATSRLVVQLEGQGFRMRADALRHHLAQMETLRGVVARYVDVLFTLFAQSAACNRVHSIDQRIARWLLMTHDRAAADEFALTQEFLSQMLGVRRASVSLAAAGLQRAGCIKYRHGRITVVDRRALEAASCECYAVIRRRFAQFGTQ